MYDGPPIPPFPTERKRAAIVQMLEGCMMVNEGIEGTMMLVDEIAGGVADSEEQYEEKIQVLKMTIAALGESVVTMAECVAKSTDTNERLYEVVDYFLKKEQ